jgi:hypothetical protein
LDEVDESATGSLKKRAAYGALFSAFASLGFLAPLRFAPLCCSETAPRPRVSVAALSDQAAVQPGCSLSAL